MDNLLIKGRWILTQDDQGRLMENGAVLVEAGLIKALGPAREIEPLAGPNPKTLSASQGLVMPGLINGHTHLSMTLFRGLADDLPLMTWLKKHIFPAEKRLTGEMVYWGALLGCAEMISAGVTGLADMYLWADQVGRALERAGLRGQISEALYDFPSPNYGPPQNGLDFSRELARKYQNCPLIDVALAPHSAYTVSPEFYGRIVDLARELNLPLNTHAAESAQERSEVIRRYGRSPVRHLEHLGVFEAPRVLAAHLVEVDDEELEILADRGVIAVHNPQSNLKLASGVARIPEMTAKGITVILGTDGPASNNTLDMFKEMNVAAKIHKGIGRNPEALPAPMVVEMATRRAGAAIFKGPNPPGQLKAGAPADLIVLEFDAPHLTPCYNPFSHLVYAAAGGDVVHTVVGGKVLMENRQLTTLDFKEIAAKVRELNRQPH